MSKILIPGVFGQLDHSKADRGRQSLFIIIVRFQISQRKASWSLLRLHFLTRGLNGDADWISIMMGLIDVDMHSRSFSEELFPSGVAQRQSSI